MSSYTKNKKPDRDFYRHPRYNAPDGDYEKFNNSGNYRNTAVPSTQTSNYTKDRNASLNPDHSGRRPANSGRKYYGSEHQRENRNHSKSERFTTETKESPTNAYPSSTTKPSPYHGESRTASYSGHLHAQSKREHISTSDVPKAGPTNSSVMEQTKSSNTAEKHGGLIHLPKNVDIFQRNPESHNTQNSRGVRRDPARSDSSKPVVVVRPSFSNSHHNAKPNNARYDVSSSSDPAYGTTAQCKLKSDTDNGAYNYAGFNSFTQQPLTSSSSPYNSDLPVPWTEAAKAAFHQFFKSQTEVNSSSTSFHGEKPFSTYPTVNQPTGGSGISSGPGMVQPPNEIIASTMQQIVQLDATLSALLIPPGLCAQAMVLFEPLQKDPELDREWSEPEALFLRCVVLSDLDFCNTAHVEQGMWKSVFYTVLESLRSWIENPQSTQLIPKLPDRDQETAKLLESQLTSLIRKICLTEVIDSGTNQLTTLLENIQNLHHIQLAPLLSDGRPPPETKSRTRRLVYLSAQKLMLFLGDLARYREMLLGERNFGKARNWYQKAQLLIPKNGRSYNQLAVLALYTSRHLDAMFYYMRTLAASNPFATASQSLSALFNEIRPRAQNMIMQFQKPKSESVQPLCSGSLLDGQTTVIQGGRRLTHLNHKPLTDNHNNRGYNTSGINHKGKPGSKSTAEQYQQSADAAAGAADNEDEDDDEEAQAEAEEYANISLIELSKQFGLAFIHAHGKLYTKMAQKPCPLSAERLCQLFVVNMFNVDRAASMTNQTSTLTTNNSAKNKMTTTPSTTITTTNNNETKSNSNHPTGIDNFLPSSRLTDIETLRSVHHDHAARFALDTFSLVCRRAAQLLQEAPPEDAGPGWLQPDARILLSALCLWTEWMILHPEHWLPPPNHRDPTLRPHLDDWQLVARLCSQAAAWLSRYPSTRRPNYEEITPTTSLVLRLKGEICNDEKLEDDIRKLSTFQTLQDGSLFKATFLTEEVYVAGFKPMLDLTPKMYHYTGNWEPETVADFVRIEKLVLFGDYLCGIETPVLTYNIDLGIYESIVQRESSERIEDKRGDSKISGRLNTSDVSCESDDKSPTDAVSNNDIKATSEEEAETDIAALQRQRAFLQKQLDEEARLATWRHNAIRQAASGGQRAVEIEVRPIYLLPDTNCYIDWLEGIATLAQKSSNYTVLVPIVVVNELDTLSRYGSSSSGGGGVDRPYEVVGGEVTRAGLIQERAKLAIAYLEHEFEHRNSRLRALTARGSLMETIAYRNEINGGRTPGQTNDDVILTCCQHFSKEDADRFQMRNLAQSLQGDQNNQPMRLMREVVLLTSDRNLRLKALNVNIPARPLRTFVSWSRLPLMTVNSTNLLSSDSLNSSDRHNNNNGSSNSNNNKTLTDFPKLQPRGQWKQPLKY
uniref:PIN domain-containing protein n=1 Tax=Trichobilharzia regenti TaxID=157069 RepID=A0AA85K6P9_TRIRE|nr:unnamed protein product [Trichobilharzia regenti]